jgi:hypothetical protein
MPSEDRQRLLIVLTTVVLNVVVVAALVWVPWSNWRSAVALSLVDNTILVGYAVLARDALLGRLILFGLLAGFVELAADAWIVGVTHTLDYSIGGGPMLWRSPAWMPFAWEGVAVQFGCIGMFLIERLGWRGALVTGAIGAINIPYYEELARLIHWWQYRGIAMFPGTHTPWPIIIGEFLIAACFAWYATWLRKPGVGRTALAGVCAGASIFAGYALPYWVFLRLG